APVRICERLGVRFPRATRRLVHCRSEQEAKALKAELQARLAECRLEMHPTKTRIVYCKDDNRKGQYPNIQFDCLGYCFRPRQVRRMRDNVLFGGFNPAVSPAALNTMRATVRDLNLRRQRMLLRRCLPCCDTSIRRSWPGRSVSSSAFSVVQLSRASL